MDDHIQHIIERLRKNEEIAQKFIEVETRILSILDFKDFFEILLSEIQKKFAVPYVWLSLIDNCEISDLIKAITESDILKENLNLITRAAFLDLLGGSNKPILANRNLKPFFRLLPKKRKYVIKSLAVVPITLDGEIIGSLNHADILPSRFQPGLDTSFLEQLAVRVSLCLSNVTAHEKLKYSAYHDVLTGLLNRRIMEGVLKREWMRAIRYSIPLSVVFIDLNGFKKANDNHGHAVGDAILKHVSGLLLSICRETDVLTRYGGDEFIIIMPQTLIQKGNAFLKRLDSLFEKNPFLVGDVSIPISACYGIASTDDETADSPQSLIRLAAERLSYTKMNRGNNYSRRNIILLQKIE